MTDVRTAEYRLRDYIEDKIEDLYASVDERFGVRDYTLKPSQIKAVLDEYDLGDGYKDWFDESGEEWE